MTDKTDETDELPPSAKLVLKVLEDADGPLSTGDIVEESRLPARTTRYGLECLRDAELVQSEPVAGERERQHRLVATLA